MVLPADKGRASVILDADTYHAKMSALIDSGPYQLLNKDPTDRLTRKLSEKLLTLKRNGHLSEAVYDKIRPRHKQSPMIYGLPRRSTRPTHRLGQLCRVSTPLHTTCLLSWLKYYLLLQVTRTSNWKTQLTSPPPSPVKRSRTTRLWCFSPGWPHDTYTSSNRGPLGFRIKIYVFPVQRIDLRTTRRRSHGEPCIRGYC